MIKVDVINLTKLPLANQVNGSWSHIGLCTVQLLESCFGVAEC